MDEREIFLEKTKSEELSQELSQEQPEVKEKPAKPVNIQSNNSAFKPRENVNAPNTETKGFESLFFSMFMDFCKQQLLIHATNAKNASALTTEKKVSNCTSLSQISNNETPKLMRHASSPPATLERNEFTTPHIRKSISIIQKFDKNEEITPDKRKMMLMERPERMALTDKTNLMEKLKRPANYIISEFESKNSKKVHVNDENSYSSYESFSTKSNDFKRSENMLVEMKRENKF